MKKTLIIVPAYQEEANILQVLKDIRGHIPQADILVVNDGSTDQTGLLARRAMVKVIDLPFNMGIGAAVQTGFKYAREHDYSEAMQIDGDYQHPAEEGPRLLQVLSDKKADLVIGSRFIAPTGYRGSWFRRTGNRLFQWVNALVVGQEIIDNTSGFRAYSRRAIELLSQTYLGDYPEPESIGYLKSQGCSIIEIPVQMRNRMGGTSSITPLRSVYYMVRVLASILSFKKQSRG
ncbi:MAG: glycosyl transferase family 2 [Desulfobacca sp.]|nr:glycosyl transferase family 2 [Desulfobacca sp.]